MQAMRQNAAQHARQMPDVPQQKVME